MSTINQMTTVPADLIGAQTPQPGPQPADQNAQASTSSAQASQPSSAESERLTIQESAEAGVFVYTILDRASGRVLAQIPREEVVQLAARPDYTAGQVINTKA